MTQVTLNNLFPFTRYEVTVAAVTGGGIGSSSTPVVFQTRIGVPTAAPSNVRLQDVTTDLTATGRFVRNVQVAWEPPPPDTLNGPVTYVIKIELLEDIGDETNLVEDFGFRGRRRRALVVTNTRTVRVTTTSAVINRLLALSVYNISVAASTTSGQGPSSATWQIVTQPGRPTDAPVILSAQQESSFIILTWSTINEPRGELLGYMAYLRQKRNEPENPEGDNTYVDESKWDRAVQVNERKYTFVDVQPGTDYELRVAAMTEYGTGPASPTEFVRTFDASDTTNVTAIVLGVLFPLLFIVLFAGWLYRKERKKTTVLKREIESKDRLLDLTPYDFKNLPKDMKEQHGNKGLYEDFHLKKVPREINAEHLTRLNKLGHGQFGEVWRVEMDEKKPGYPPCMVAAKLLLPNATKADAVSLLQEAHLMAQFDHENVIRLVGVSTIGSPVVVLEYCANGALDSYLKKHDLKLGWQLYMLMDVASAFVYLSATGFVHRDLAARNILLTENLVCKVSDFGLSRDLIDDSEYYTASTGKIPIRWTAPEAVVNKKFSTATDVWAFGVLLYEMFTKAAKPYGSWSNFQVQMEVLNGYRLPRPERCPANVWAVSADCWHKDPHTRPQFKTILERLVEVASERRLTDPRGQRVTGPKLSLPQLSHTGLSARQQHGFTGSDRLPPPTKPRPGNEDIMEGDEEDSGSESDSAVSLCSTCGASIHSIELSAEEDEDEAMMHMAPLSRRHTRFKSKKSSTASIHIQETPLGAEAYVDLTGGEAIREFSPGPVQAPAEGLSPMVNKKSERVRYARLEGMEDLTTVLRRSPTKRRQYSPLGQTDEGLVYAELSWHHQGGNMEDESDLSDVSVCSYDDRETSQLPRLEVHPAVVDAFLESVGSSNTYSELAFVLARNTVREKDNSDSDSSSCTSEEPLRLSPVMQHSQDPIFSPSRARVYAIDDGRPDSDSVVVPPLMPAKMDLADKFFVDSDYFGVSSDV